MKKLSLLVACAALCGCQAITSSSGQLQGITIPAGCKGSFAIMLTASMMVDATIQGSCDETAATSATDMRFNWAPAPGK